MVCDLLFVVLIVHGGLDGWMVCGFMLLGWGLGWDGLCLLFFVWFLVCVSWLSSCWTDTWFAIWLDGDTVLVYCYLVSGWVDREAN